MHRNRNTHSVLLRIGRMIYLALFVRSSRWLLSFAPHAGSTLALSLPENSIWLCTGLKQFAITASSVCTVQSTAVLACLYNRRDGLVTVERERKRERETLETLYWRYVLLAPALAVESFARESDRQADGLFSEEIPGPNSRLEC